MRVKLVLTACAVAGLVYGSTHVQVMGETPYGHFRKAGGEQAVESAWAWCADRGSEGLDWAWQHTRGGGQWLWTKCQEGVHVAWLWASSGWAESPSPKGASNETVPGSKRAAAKSPLDRAELSRRETEGEETPRPRPSASEPALSQLQALDDSSRSIPAAKTRVDARIRPEQKAALNRRLSALRDP